MSLTNEQMRKLRYRQTLYHTVNRNADGTPQRWSVNGRVKTWKAIPWRIEVPLKRGLNEYGYLDHLNKAFFCLTEAEAMEKPKAYKT